MTCFTAKFWRECEERLTICRCIWIAYVEAMSEELPLESNFFHNLSDMCKDQHAHVF